MLQIIVVVVKVFIQDNRMTEIKDDDVWSFKEIDELYGDMIGLLDVLEKYPEHEYLSYELRNMLNSVFDEYLEKNTIENARKFEEVYTHLCEINTEIAKTLGD